MLTCSSVGEFTFLCASVSVRAQIHSLPIMPPEHYSPFRFQTVRQHLALHLATQACNSIQLTHPEHRQKKKKKHSLPESFKVLLGTGSVRRQAPRREFSISSESQSEYTYVELVQTCIQIRFSSINLMIVDVMQMNHSLSQTSNSKHTRKPSFHYCYY